MNKLQAEKRVILKNILFLTDFSEPSSVALPFATAIARSYGSIVHALHVILPSAYTYMTPEAATTLLNDQEETAKAEMQRVEADLVGVPHEAMIERGGSVWPVLSEILKEGNIDLIVMGTHGRTGLQKMLIGSSAEEVFRRANIPVLTIGPTVRSGAHNAGRFRGVLLATDFHPASLAAAPYAISLAQENQSRLVLLHVLPKRGHRNAYKADERSVAEAMHRLYELVPEEAELWCRPEAMVRHGEPGDQILAAAQECKADLIVVGARGIESLTAMASHITRATAYKVVAHSTCPVLTVKS
jgi:nucleotide-binding universal stress UspA family protein